MRSKREVDGEEGQAVSAPIWPELTAHYFPRGVQADAQADGAGNLGPLHARATLIAENIARMARGEPPLIRVD